MAKLKEQIGAGCVRIPFVSPLPHRFVMEYFMMREELERVKQRLAEIENREEAIVLREMTREEAKQEIRQIFQSGRTLYYSDIANELALDLRLVVDVCRELQENKEIGIDNDALARTS